MSCNNCEVCSCQKPKMVSVTKVLNETKPYQDREALENWKLRVGEEEANRISEEAKARGRKLDQDFEQYDKTGSCENLGLHKFMLDYKIIKREFDLVSEHLMLKGRLDTIVQDKEGDNILFDFKTSRKKKQSAFIEDYYLQLGAYCLMLDAETEIKINSAKIVIFIQDQFTPQVFRLNRFQLEGYAMKFYNRLLQYRNENKAK